MTDEDATPEAGGDPLDDALTEEDIAAALDQLADDGVAPPAEEPLVTEDDIDLVDRLFGLGAVQPGDVDFPAAEGGAGATPLDLAGYGSCEEALEDAVASLERVTAERDEYLAVAQRVQADFENYKRRVDAQRVEQAARAAESLVEELLPVLDGCEAALAHGAEDVAPIWSSLFGTLEKRGLAKVDETEVVFDPNRHEAVLSEEGDGIDGEPAVAEIMRAGYQWNGRVIRPAMVKVRG